VTETAQRQEIVQVRSEERQVKVEQQEQMEVMVLSSLTLNYQELLMLQLGLSQPMRLQT
jgi:hypothetical protein